MSGGWSEEMPPAPPQTRESGAAPFLAAVAVNAAAGTLFAWSVLLPALSTEFGVPPDDLGIVFSSALVVFAVAVLLGGGAVDRNGPRRAATIAGALSGGGLALAAVAPNVLTLHLGIGVLFGVGSGLAYLSAVSWASTRGGRRRTRAISVVVAAYAAGPAAAAPLGAFGADRFGWRPTLAVSAVVVSAVVLGAGRGLPGPLGAQRGAKGSDPAPPIGDPTALAALWLLFLGAVAPGLLAFAYAAQVATERGVPAHLSGLVVAAMAAGNLAGRLMPAPLATRNGLHVALWASLAALVLALVALGWSSAATVAVPSLTLLAVEYGLVSAMLPAATREVSGDLRFGAAYGRVFSSFGVAAVAGPALGAALHDGADGYARGFQASLLGAALAVAALTTYQSRLRRAAPPDVGPSA